MTIKRNAYNSFDITIGQTVVKIRPATITVNGKRFSTWWDAEERTTGSERRAVAKAKAAYREQRAAA